MAESKVYAELQAATGIGPPADGEGEQAYLYRMLTRVATVPDVKWDRLSAKAQDWYNAACDARENYRLIPPFPDLVLVEKRRPQRREGQKPATQVIIETTIRYIDRPKEFVLSKVREQLPEGSFKVSSFDFTFGITHKVLSAYECKKTR